MLIEHPSHAYDPEQVWQIMDAQHEFVAVASWGDWFSSDTGFNRGGQHWQTTKVIAAESDSLGTLETWADKQRRGRAHSVRFHRTWPITEGRLAGKRDNARIELTGAKQ